MYNYVEQKYNYIHYYLYYVIFTKNRYGGFEVMLSKVMLSFFRMLKQYMTKQKMSVLLKIYLTQKMCLTK